MTETTWNSKGYKKFDSERAKEYACIANEVFAPVYPVIAGLIVERCAVKQGMCVDVGSGAANLAVALTKITDFTTLAMDFSSHIFPLAIENIDSAELTDRIKLIAGDVHRIPLLDNTAELVVSRGSMRFWKNKPAAFREIKRILKPGGKGFVGGGVGSAELDKEIGQKMSLFNKRTSKRPKYKYQMNDIPYFIEVMKKAGFDRFEIINNDSGFWIYMEKEEQ